MARIPGGLWHDLIAIQVYGANTGVGKTVFSTLLAAHVAKKKVAGTKLPRFRLHYVKPVSTGPADEADDRYVRKYAGVPVQTLFKFSDPVSPHVAARSAGIIPSDGRIVRKLYRSLREAARLCTVEEKGFAIVETAGGVLSPSPTGSLQADMFRSLRLPVVLVGDHRLGGIASTISAYESLTVRGYDIVAVVCFDDKGPYENAAYLKRYFMERGISAFTLPWIPFLGSCTKEEETEMMGRYYTTLHTDGKVAHLTSAILDKHNSRLNGLTRMASDTRKTIWHPFTQHKSIETDEDILVFDSAYGDDFQVKHTRRSCASAADDQEILYPAYDGSASWWTQGLGHGDSGLALHAAYAAGRYGHIMFAGATHEPALELAKRLLAGLENPRLTKCFYTDDGSTAVEVGIKMALRAACKRYDWDGSSDDIGILGLKGSYHGDTIGAMDASEPSVYNKKVDWYRGRGYWFDFPTVKMRKGTWFVEPPVGQEAEFGPTQSFESLTAIFDFAARGQSTRYEKYVEDVLDNLVKQQGMKFGALVMEPIILGAGGMIFVDPLFQRTLVDVVRKYMFSSSHPVTNSQEEHAWAGVPVLFDEVFTGLYRLGRFSAASFLQVDPDISTHAKLLTAGILPLSATLASESIYNAFLGDEKADALLHGHSYTAHPIGCTVANVGLKAMRSFSMFGWDRYRENWGIAAKEINEPGVGPFASANPDKLNATFASIADDPSEMDSQEDTVVENEKPVDGMWSMWSKETVTQLSNHPSVDHVTALGSVLALALKDDSGAGYSSNAAVELRDNLLYNPAPGTVQVHSRILGNVIYLIARINSSSTVLATVENALRMSLDQVAGIRTSKSSRQPVDTTVAPKSS